MSIKLFDTARGDYTSVPQDAQAVAPYMDGLYKNDTAARARFPNLAAVGRILTITCRKADADVLDWEAGNTCPPPEWWWQQQHQLGRWRPCFYANQSDMRTILPALERVLGKLGQPGPARPVRLWIAHPTGKEHLCGPLTCGFPWEADATQYWWSSLQGGGADIDISTCRDDFFNTPIPPAPEDYMSISVAELQGTPHVFVEAKDGSVWYTWQKKGQTGWTGGKAGKQVAGLVPFAPAPPQ
jgi:hypothetical protein